MALSKSRTSTRSSSRAASNAGAVVSSRKRAFPESASWPILIGTAACPGSLRASRCRSSPATAACASRSRLIAPDASRRTCASRPSSSSDLRSTAGASASISLIPIPSRCHASIGRPSGSSTFTRFSAEVPLTLIRGALPSCCSKAITRRVSSRADSTLPRSLNGRYPTRRVRSNSSRSTLREVRWPSRKGWVAPVTPSGAPLTRAAISGTTVIFTSAGRLEMNGMPTRRSAISCLAPIARSSTSMRPSRSRMLNTANRGGGPSLVGCASASSTRSWKLYVWSGLRTTRTCGPVSVTASSTGASRKTDVQAALT